MSFGARPFGVNPYAVVVLPATTPNAVNVVPRLPIQPHPRFLAPIIARGLPFAPATQTVSVALTGQGATYSQGTLVPGNSVPLTGSLVTYGQGNLVPGSSLALTGLAGTYSQGTLIPAPSIPLVGQAATYSQGAITPATSVPLVGQLGTYSQGNVLVPGDVTVALTGLVATYVQGDLVADTGAAGRGRGSKTRKARRKRIGNSSYAEDLEDEIQETLAALTSRANPAAAQQSLGGASPATRGAVADPFDDEEEVAAWLLLH
jgi:hypothetical protein